MEHCIYDGVDLAERFTCAGVVRPIPTFAPKTETVAGSGRLFVRGMDLVPPTITFRLVHRGETREDRRDATRWLASTLYTDTPVMLSFSDEPELAYKVLPSGEASITERVNSGAVDVSLMCVESAAYGAKRSVTSTNGAASFEVGGNTGTTLKITSTSAVRHSSSDYRWGLYMNNAGDSSSMSVMLPTSQSSTVVIDAEGRHATVNGSTAQLTVTSDWPDVRVGTVSLSRWLGTGEYTVEWTERWL